MIKSIPSYFNKRALVYLCAGLISLPAAEPKYNLFSALDVGRIENGYDMLSNYDPSGLILVRNHFSLGYTSQLDEKNLISLGVGGMFWKSYESGGMAKGEKNLGFGPGITHAYMKYDFTENIGITYGFIGYKYNAAAKNLGEYLFRTEAYPTLIYTGGWSWMNAAGYGALGEVFTWNAWDGKFKSDLIVAMEYFNYPIYDITPAYVATWKPAGFLTLGGAVALHRLISPTPNTKDELQKEYVYVKDVPLQNGRLFTGLRSDLDNSEPAKADTLNYPSQTVSFDLAATKVLGFFELDLRALLGKSKEELGDFNIYGESALLGLKNYPVFYTDYSQRLVTMLGLSIPVPHVFDHISVEMEYLKNPIVECITTYDAIDLVPFDNFRYKTFSKDDFKWSLHASRKFGPVFTIFLQAANDHIRLKNSFTNPNYIPLTNEPSHWYWMTRLQWAI